MATSRELQLKRDAKIDTILEKIEDQETLLLDIMEKLNEFKEFEKQNNKTTQKNSKSK